MATRTEILSKLTVIQKDSYRNVIDASKKVSVDKKVKFVVLSNFLYERMEKTRNLLGYIEDTYRNTDLQGDYSIFRGALDTISGKEDDLDTLNGLISQTVYGDVRLQRRYKREVAEMDSRLAVIQNRIISNLDTFSEDLDELKNSIPD